MFLVDVKRYRSCDISQILLFKSYSTLWGRVKKELKQITLADTFKESFKLSQRTLSTFHSDFQTTFCSKLTPWKLCKLFWKSLKERNGYQNACLIHLVKYLCIICLDPNNNLEPVKWIFTSIRSTFPTSNICFDCSQANIMICGYIPTHMHKNKSYIIL